VRRLAWVVALGAALGSTEARAEDAAEPNARPTPLWLALQLVPSPEVAFDDQRAAFGLRWQITPLAYSWGINRRLEPWRVLVVEPLVRHSGSVELFFEPGMWIGAETTAVIRAGARAYFPIVEHGEVLSFSAGAGYQYAWEQSAAMVELGLYTLFGILGLRVSVAFGDVPVAGVVTLSLRYF